MQFLSKLVLLTPSGIGCHGRFWLSYLGPLVLLVPNTFNLFGFSKLSILIVPCEDYSRNASCALN